MNILPVVETVVANSSIDVVRGRMGCGLKGISYSTSLKMGFSVAGYVYAEVDWSKWLDGAWAAMFVIYKPQERFIDRACEIEFKVGILSIYHVWEVLV